MTDEPRDGKDIEEIADAWAAVCIDIAEKLDRDHINDSGQREPKVVTPEPGCRDGE
jgi:hypothetical protein